LPCTLLGLLLAAYLSSCGNGGGVTPENLAASVKPVAQRSLDRRAAEINASQPPSVLVQTVVCDPIQSQRTVCRETVLGQLGTGAETVRVILAGKHWTATPVDDAPSFSGVVATG
jgi:hypothetical protein